jgi:outer membrane protein
MQLTLKSAVLAACLVACVGAVQAQSAGSWSVRVGATEINPQVSSGDLSAPSLPGSKADVKSDTELTGGIAYMVTDNIAIDLPLSTPFKHDIVGAGAIAGAGKIAEVKALPITLLGQYRFLEASAPLRPYVGAGVTYVKFYDETSTAALSAITGGSPANPTTLNIDSKLAATFQLGASYAVNKQWFLDAFVTKTPLKTKTQLSTGQSLDLTLDPYSVSLAVGYRF